MLKTTSILFAGLLAIGTAHAQDTDEDGEGARVDKYRSEARALRKAPTPRRTPKRPTAPAAAADLVVGAGLRDAAGIPIGTIDAVRDGGVVIASGDGKVEVDAAAIRKDAQGLFLVIPKARFDALVAEVRARRLAGQAPARP